MTIKEAFDEITRMRALAQAEMFKRGKDKSYHTGCFVAYVYTLEILRKLKEGAE